MWVQREETMQGTSKDIYSYIQQIEKKYGYVLHDIECFTPSVVEATIRYGVQFDEKVNITWEERKRKLPRSLIKKVIFNNPATIVMWKDGTKTVVKAEGEDYDPEKGLAMAIAKKAYDNQGNYYNEFKKWLPKEN